MQHTVLQSILPIYLFLFPFFSYREDLVGQEFVAGEFELVCTH